MTKSSNETTAELNFVFLHSEIKYKGLLSDVKNINKNIVLKYIRFCCYDVNIYNVCKMFINIASYICILHM